MQTIIQRSIWLAIAAATMAITIGLSIDLADKQPLLLAIIILAAVVQSVAFVYAGLHWRVGGRASAFAALYVGLLSLCVSVVAGTSYWSSSIQGVNDEIAREQTSLATQDMVRERRRQHLAKITAGKSPEQIEAEMQASLTKPYGDQTLGVRTADCTDTSSWHFRYCTPFLELKSQHAAAVEARDLETKVWNDGTKVVSVAIRRNFYEFARLASENLGGDVRTWILVVVGLLEAFLQSLHMFALFIGFAPVRRLERAAAPEAVLATSAPEIIVPAAVPPLKLAEEAFKGRDDDDPAPVPPPPPLKPNRDGAVKELERPDLARKPVNQPSQEVGQPAPVAASVFFDEADDENVVQFLNKKQHEKLTKVKKKDVKPEGDVKAWLGECTSQVSDRSIVAKSGVCRQSYEAWCGINGFRPIGKRAQSRRMGVILGLAAGERAAGDRGPRDGDGAIWPGLKVFVPSRDALKARA